MSLISLDKVSIKNTPKINEDMIQKYISDNPSVLGLGDLATIRREKTQPTKGRIDIMLQDDDNTRFEVEVQLGATDPSHIIRTIEYWDVERKRYPQYDHCAVIIAEEVNSRFMNVISLFNGAIPLIAIQMSAYQNGSDYVLTFTKVLDRLSLATDDENFEPTDRNYWENRSTKKIMSDVDSIFTYTGLPEKGYELKYNKFYIGISKDGYVKNFIEFKPKKSFLYYIVKGEEDNAKLEKIENTGLDVKYDSRWKEYKIRIEKLDQFNKNKELLLSLLKDSMDYYNVNSDE